MRPPAPRPLRGSRQASPAPPSENAPAASRSSADAPRAPNEPDGPRAPNEPDGPRPRRATMENVRARRRPATGDEGLGPGRAGAMIHSSEVPPPDGVHSVDSTGRKR